MHICSNFMEFYSIYANIQIIRWLNMKFSPSERVLIKEVMEISQKMKATIRGLSIGSLIKSIRTQLGMPQKTLAKRANVPQSTIFRIEQGQKNTNLLTLRKVLNALSCELVIAPLLQDSIDNIRCKQAKKVVEKQVRYLKGTMYLEDQQPDSSFIEELLKQKEESLLQGPNSKLWEE